MSITKIMKILELHRRMMQIMKIPEFHMITTKVMKILEFHARITKILKILEFHANHENHENLRIPCGSNELFAAKEWFCATSHGRRILQTS